jgi:hypothetical protein
MTDCISCPAALKAKEAEMCGSCIERHTKRALAQQKEQIAEIVSKLNLHPNNGGLAAPNFEEIRDAETAWRRCLLSVQDFVKRKIGEA